MWKHAGGGERGCCGSASLNATETYCFAPERGRQAYTSGAVVKNVTGPSSAADKNDHGNEININITVKTSLVSE